MTGLDLQGQPARVDPDLRRGSFLSWDPQTGLGGRSVWAHAQSASSSLRSGWALPPEPPDAGAVL